jgi:integrase
MAIATKLALHALKLGCSVSPEATASADGGNIARRRFQNGSVFLKGEWWYGRYRERFIDTVGNEQCVRRSARFGKKKDMTKYEAKRALAAILGPSNAVSYRPGRIATVEEFSENWRREVLSKQEPSSIRSANSHLRCYILPFLGKIKLHELSVETQQGFVTRVGNKVSRKTTLNVIATLSSLLSTAENWGFTTETIQVKKLALPKRGMKYEAHCFTVDELRRILAAASNPWRVLYCILTMDGLRAGEALGLQWQDIDLNRRLLNIRRSAWCGRIKTAKNESSETVLPIPEPLAEILRQYRQDWKPNPAGFLFATRNGRPPSSNKVIEYQLGPLLDALDLERRGLHVFRHTHTSLLLESGANIKVVQRQLRHSDERTTLGVYAHVVGDAQRQAVEKVALIVDPNGPRPGLQTVLIQ